MVREGLRGTTVALRSPTYREQLRHEQRLKDDQAQSAVVKLSSRKLVKRRRRSGEDNDSDGPVFSSSSSDSSSDEDLFIPIPRKRKVESEHSSQSPSNPQSPVPDEDDLYKAAWTPAHSSSSSCSSSSDDEDLFIPIPRKRKCESEHPSNPQSTFPAEPQNDKTANAKGSSPLEPRGSPPETEAIPPISLEELKREDPVDIASEEAATASSTSATVHDVKSEHPSSPEDVDLNAEVMDNCFEQIFEDVDWQEILETDSLPGTSELDETRDN